MNLTPSPRTRALFPVVVLVAVLAITASAASAGTVTGSGSPGKASVPQTIGAGTYPNITITAPNRTVTESPAYAAYDQWVCVTPRLWVLNGSTWTFVIKKSQCNWIPASSTSVVLPGVTFTGIRTLTSYGVDVLVTWKLANNTVIGTKTYDYSSATDYQCSGAACQVYDSSVGAYMFFYF